MADDKVEDQFLKGFEGLGVDREDQMNMLALLAAGHAINMQGNDPTGGLKLKDDKDEVPEDSDEEDLANKRQDAAFNYLYKKAIVQVEPELETRI